MPAGRAAARVSTARDGRGNSAIVETGIGSGRSREGSDLPNRNLPGIGDDLINAAIAKRMKRKVDWEAECARQAADDVIREANALPQ